MQIADPFLLAINVSTITLLGFNASLLIARRRQNLGYLALALSFFSVLLVTSQESLKYLAPSLQLPVLILSLPALLLIAPCFWIYIKAITSDSRWQFKKKDTYHFALPIVGLVISILTFLLPSDIKHALLVVGDETLLANKPLLLRTSLYGGLIITFGLILGWVFQSAYYLIKTVRHLVVYRDRLKDIFSTTEQKEMRWLKALCFMVGVPWCVIVLNLLLDNLFFPDETIAKLANISLLICTVFICFWGSRQKPGFEEVYSGQSFDSEQVAVIDQKYKTSALDDDLLRAIAEKLNYAMEKDKVFLDASLSLPKLAKHIATSTHYISQTLNETLNASFFDYVNRYRVMYAKNELTGSEKTVIDIAMAAGFNSKSAFYTAFKKNVGQTPKQFRQSNRK